MLTNEQADTLKQLRSLGYTPGSCFTADEAFPDGRDWQHRLTLRLMAARGILEQRAGDGSSAGGGFRIPQSAWDKLDEWNEKVGFRDSA